MSTICVIEIVTNHESHLRRLGRLLASFALITGAVVVAAPAGVVRAAADITVTQSIPGATLIGTETAVDVSIANDGDTTAYNVAIVVRLPLGVSLSSSDSAPSDIITETSGGTPTGTVIAWENVVDVVPDGFFHFRYSLAHDVGDGVDLWSVGETFSAPVEVYASDDDATIPGVEAETTGGETTAVVTGSTTDAFADGSTTLVPLLLTKSEPSPEGELLRGVHDHQTLYTLSARTGADPGVSVTTIDDWIPAGIEFLGCGDTDNSTSEEYPGSGPLNPGNAPDVGACLAPSLVETVDSGLPAGLTGVFTHVQWQIDQTLAADSTVTLSYVAGIPQRANVTAWPDGTPATDGAQGSNLDNNTGPFTTQVDDGSDYTNLAQIDTTFNGISTTVEARAAVNAVDLAVHKYVDQPTIQQGGVSTWSLVVESSEYVVADGVDNLALVDTTPDGTCPIGSVNTSCTLPAPGPVPPYSSSSLGPGPGQTTLEWNQVEQSMGPSESFTLAFSTEALSNYSNGAPVSSGDGWSNVVDLDADVTTFGPNGPDDTDSFATNPATDDSSRAQSGTAVSFRKDVGRPANGQECGNGSDIVWVPDTVTVQGPGDRVCFRLTAVPPDALDTIDATLVDFLPAGYRFEVGSSVPGVDNEVPPQNITDVTVTGDAANGERLEWDLRPTTTIEPASTAQVVFSAILDGGVTPDLVDSGDLITNSARFSFQNTGGEIFVASDTASVTYTEPHLGLTKGISAVGSTTYNPVIDPATDVGGNQIVTYAIDITNDGASDAIGVDVIDLLPVNNDGITLDDATCPAVGNISDGGMCASDDLMWTGLTVPAGGTVRLTYDWTLPVAVAISSSWTNEAGILEYQSSTNTGTPYTYIPRENINPDPGFDPSTENTDPANDDAQIFSPGISMTKARTTAIDEPGNAASNQAAIGEVISFTVETRQSAGTEAENYLLTDDLTGTGMTLVDGTATYSTYLAPEGIDCTAGTPVTTGLIPDTSTPNVITIAGVDVIATPGDDGCVVLTFDAVVDDVAQNVRPGLVSNEAVLTFDADPSPDDTLDRTLTAGVDTQVVEPNIALDKTSSTADDLSAGGTATYSIVITNQTGTQVSTAHDLLVIDDYAEPRIASVDYVSNGGVDTGGTITWDLSGDPDGDGTAGLSPGQSMTLTYDVTFASPLPANGRVANVAAVTASSIDDLGPDDAGGERTNGSACSPAQCPGYSDGDIVTLDVAEPLLTKGVAKPLHTIGDEVTYAMEAVFPANLFYGSDAVTITDDLSDGATTFIETVSQVCVSCSDADRAQYTAPEDNGTASTDTPLWDFGVLATSPRTRRVIIVYRVRVENDAAVGAGDTLTNTATLTYETGSDDDDATITIAEPDVSVVKRIASDLEPTLRETTDITPVPAEPGSTVSYQLAITNIGDWTAYDVPVTDEPDSVETAGDCSATPRLSVIDVATGPTWTVTDEALGASDGCLGWTLPVILPGQTITIDYQLLVPDDFPRDDLIAGPEYVNLAEIAAESFWALDDGDRAGNPDARPYAQGAITDAGHVNLNGGILGDFVWFDVNGDGVQDPGEPGLADVTVTVAGPAGSVDHVTGTDGNWLTTDESVVPPTWLIEGDYTITVDTGTLPFGITTNTGDPDGTTDSTTTTTLDENEDDRTQDFGYAATGSVGDLVWLDLDGDGSQNNGEPGIPGVDLDAMWSGFDGAFGGGDDIDIGSATTDPIGDYSIARVPTGQTLVTVDTTPIDTAGLIPTYDLDDGTTAPDDSATRTLTIGEDAEDVDFGYNGTGSLGDTIWLDYDGDGVQDPAEPGIPDVDLTIVWGGLDGAIGGGDDVTMPTVTTAADGTYTQLGLPAGAYTITVDPTTLPGGVGPTYDLDDGTTTADGAAARTLTIGEDAEDVDFGYNGTGSLGDTIWLDIDGDGVQDPGEPGLPGVTVTATLGSITVPSVITAADGAYTIPNLPGGDYTVEVDVATLPAGLVPTDDLDGTATPNVTAATLADGEDRDDVDFGYTGTASVGDQVWIDFDLDDVRDGNEPGLENIDVTVTWDGGDGTFGDGNEVVYPVAITNDDGIYVVTNLPAGTVRVEADETDLPPGLGLTASYDLDRGDDSTTDRDLSNGEAATDVDFGYVGGVQVGDLVWWDLNADGTQDAGEPGLDGVTITLTWAGLDGSLDTADDVSKTTTTDADADADLDNYEFSSLPAGTYRVTVEESTLPTGLTITADPDAALDGVSEFAPTVQDPVDLDQDFGYRSTGSIGDIVWLDFNDDGVQDAGEPGISGVTVTAEWEGLDGDIAQTADNLTYPADGPTGVDGLYTISNLPPGEFRVDVDTTTLPAGLDPTYDLNGPLDNSAERTIAAGVDATDVDFGYAGTGSIGDRVWEEGLLGANGTEDPFDTGIENVVVTATWAGPNGTLGDADDVEFPVATTNVDGNYAIEGLPAGLYSVATSDIPAGLAPVYDLDGLATPNVAERTLAAGEDADDLDFGYTGSGSIGDLVWYDADGDGLGPDNGSDADDLAELGIPGVVMAATWAGFDGEFETTEDNGLFIADDPTNADGRYTISGLPPGDYRVRPVSGVPDGMSPTYDLDGTGTRDLAARTLTVTDDAVEVADDVDFGYTADGSLGDLVWLDIDADGNGPDSAAPDADPTEPGIAGLPVQVVWAGFDGDIAQDADNLTFDTVTDVDGRYSVESLPPGEHTVSVDTTSIPGLEPTYDFDGAGTADNAVRTLVGTMDTVEDAGDVDFGYAGTGSLGDLVWLDVDADGSGPDSAAPDADPTEPGIAGVTVTITWNGPGGNTVTFPASTTDPDGRYTQANLPAGDYVITTSGLPAGIIATHDLDGTATPNTSERTLADTNGTAEAADDVDFGYAGTASLGDFVWLDVDTDGVQDPSEPGIPNAAVSAIWDGPDGTFDTADDVDYPVATTAADGLYTIANLPPGRHRVTVDPASLPDGLRSTADRDLIPNGTTTRPLDPDEAVDDVDFGYTGSAAVGDLVWLDRNQDDALSALEPGIPNITATAVWAGFNGTLGDADDIEFPSVVTGADGMYLIENLPVGDVQVTVGDAGLIAAGLDRTFDADGTLDGTTVRNLTAATEDRLADFAYRGANTVGDLVWFDPEGDGVGPDSGDADDPGVQGQTVVVRWAGPNGVFDTNPVTSDDLVFLPVVTGTDGRWSVDGVPDGPIRVSLVGGPASDLAVSSDRDGSLDRVTESTIEGDDAAFDFGLTGTAVLGNYVWWDVDGDSRQDLDERGFPGVDVSIVWAGGSGVPAGLTYEAITDTAGMYGVGNLPPGDYTVTVDATDLPEWADQTFDLDGTVTPDTAERAVAVGATANNVDFGYAGTAELGDFVWWDLDADGVQDPNEPGLPSVDLDIIWLGDDDTLGTADDYSYPPVTTDSAGAYGLAVLPLGSFVVAVDVTTLPDGMDATFDLDGTATPDTAIRFLTIEATADDIDFGYTGDLTIGDLVWDDTNLDGNRQTTEPAIGGAGITVQFLGVDGTDGGGDDVFFQVTTADPPVVAATSRLTEAAAPRPGEPFYEVDGLVPGDYIVTLDPTTLSFGTTPSTDLDGGNPASTAITLGSPSDLDADFAVFTNTPPDWTGQAVSSACGNTTIVDPLVGVTDINGDDVTLVPGTVVAPSGITVVELPDGRLQITAGNATSGSFEVRWTVEDSHGAQVEVTLGVTVTCSIPLPPTGSNPLPINLAALLMIGVGVLLMSIRRRHTTSG